MVAGLKNKGTLPYLRKSGKRIAAVKPIALLD
jgi:hypothetical protein